MQAKIQTFLNELVKIKETYCFTISAEHLIKTSLVRCSVGTSNTASLSGVITPCGLCKLLFPRVPSEVRVSVHLPAQIIKLPAQPASLVPLRILLDWPLPCSLSLLLFRHQQSSPDYTRIFWALCHYAPQSILPIYPVRVTFAKINKEKHIDSDISLPPLKKSISPPFIKINVRPFTSFSMAFETCFQSSSQITFQKSLKDICHTQSFLNHIPWDLLFSKQRLPEYSMSK